MKKIKVTILSMSICLLFSLSVTGCASNENKDGNSIKTSTEITESSSESKVEKNKTLEMYNKVNLGMTKDQVDSVISVKPRDGSTEYVKNVFHYQDGDGGYGVTVINDSNNKVIGKTAIVGFWKELASLINKGVKEEQKEKIKNDMTYTDVISILGGEGLEYARVSRATKDDYSLMGLTRIWPNKDGTCMLVMFSKDDKVTGVQFDKSSPNTK